MQEMVLCIAHNINQNTNYKIHTEPVEGTQALSASCFTILITNPKHYNIRPEDHRNATINLKVVAAQNTKLFLDTVKPQTKMHPLKARLKHLQPR